MNPENNLRIASLRINQNGKLGIENIKAAFDAILEISEVGIQLSKKFDYRLLVKLGLKITMSGNLVEIFKTALAEFKDLDAKESFEVSGHIKQRFDIENKTLEMKIEQGIDLTQRTYQIVPGVVDLSVDWYEYFKGWDDAKVVNITAPAEAAA